MLYFVLLYVLFLIYSVIFFLTKKSGVNSREVTLSVPQKKPANIFSAGKVKISHFIIQYECPKCGYKSQTYQEKCSFCNETCEKINILTPYVRKDVSVAKA